MSKQGRVTGKIKVADAGTVEVNLPVIIFKEDGSTISYCPALDLAGYGNTEKEASESMNVVMEEYFSYTIHKKTLDKDLKKLGWKVKKNMHKKMTPPSVSTSLETNENFKRIFDNNSFKKVDTTFQIPAVA